MDKLAFRVPEAVEATGLGRSTLYREISAGRLKVVKVGNATLITRSDLEEFIEGLRSEREAPGGAAA
jgi:excisionase family DNA binding protein